MSRLNGRGRLLLVATERSGDCDYRLIEVSKDALWRGTIAFFSHDWMPSVGTAYVLVLDSGRRFRCQLDKPLEDKHSGRTHSYEVRCWPETA
jgi:hypothetical protein